MSSLSCTHTNWKDCILSDPKQADLNERLLLVLTKPEMRAAQTCVNNLTCEDAACGIKVIRRSYFLRAPRFVGMHRFMATLVRYLGGAVREQDVNHRERYAGTAKYGIGNRMWKGLRDCFAMRWVRQRLLMHEVKEEY